MIQATLKIVTTPVGEDNPEVHSQGLCLTKSLQAMGVGPVRRAQSIFRMLFEIVKVSQEE